MTVETAKALMVLNDKSIVNTISIDINFLRQHRMKR